MKKILILLFISTTIFAQKELTLDNFAYGYKISLEDKNAVVSKVKLTKDIYLDTYSKNLDDIRIFNNIGALVPFSLVGVKSEQLSLKSMGMLIFDASNNEQKVSREIEDGIFTSKYTYVYLVKLPSGYDKNSVLKSIKLEWEKADYNWKADVDASFYEDSSSKERTVVANGVLMDLKNEDSNSHLVLDVLNFSDFTLAKESNYYKKQDDDIEFNWMLRISSKTKLPKMKKAIGSFENYNLKENYFSLETKFKSHTSEEGTIYELPSSQLIKEVIISLNDENSILPAAIFYKSDEKQDNWRKLGDMVLSSFSKADNNKLVFESPILIKQIKLKPINTSYNNKPTIEVLKKELEVIFNSANNAPFTLAFGSNIAKNAAISETIFLDQEKIASASLEKKIVFSADDAYNQKSDDQDSSIPRWTIWLILSLGVLFLIFLALKLSKEIKKDI